jgi:hypothetical protein
MTATKIYAARTAPVSRSTITGTVSKQSNQRLKTPFASDLTKCFPGRRRRNCRGPLGNGRTDLLLRAVRTKAIQDRKPHTQAARGRLALSFVFRQRMCGD